MRRTFEYEEEVQMSSDAEDSEEATFPRAPIHLASSA